MGSLEDTITSLRWIQLPCLLAHPIPLRTGPRGRWAVQHVRNWRGDSAPVALICLASSFEEGLAYLGWGAASVQCVCLWGSWYQSSPDISCSDLMGVLLLPPPPSSAFKMGMSKVVTGVEISGCVEGIILDVSGRWRGHCWRLWSQQIWIWILVMLFNSYLTLGKRLTFHSIPFPQL